MWITITLEVLVTPWDWECPNTRTQGWNAQLWLPTGAGTGTLGPLCCTNLTVCMASEKKLSFFVSGCERRPQDHGPTASPPWDDRTLHWQQTDQTGTVSGGERLGSFSLHPTHRTGTRGAVLAACARPRSHIHTTTVTKEHLHPPGGAAKTPGV